MRWLSWLLGAALLVALVVAALQASEERAFMQLPTATGSLFSSSDARFARPIRTLDSKRGGTPATAISDDVRDALLAGPVLEM